ncbi:MAG: hypothetical protein ACYTKD_24000, partial [Planctomycetota bacterium]
SRRKRLDAVVEARKEVIQAGTEFLQFAHDHIGLLQEGGRPDRVSGGVIGGFHTPLEEIAL